MAELFLHGRKVRTVFDLLGNKENDITYSVGWALARCDGFLELLIKRLFPDQDVSENKSVHLQEFGSDHGYTDIEIVTEHRHIIIEAKRGWNLPTSDQLNKYRERFAGAGPENALVVMAECTTDYALSKLPQTVDGIPLRYLSWKQVADIASQSIGVSNHAEKRLLRELHRYLEGLMSMQNQTSNLVYVVALGHGTPGWSSISWRKMVTDKQRYFHPFGPGWPKEPPNYIGFRYDGKLQSVHHVDDYKVMADVTNISDDLPEIDGAKWRALDKAAHFLYTLGPAIIPHREVMTGSIWPSGRVWVMLDLLLTCPTISEARDLTQERLRESTKLHP